jgi:hypothetical protein
MRGNISFSKQSKSAIRPPPLPKKEEKRKKKKEKERKRKKKKEKERKKLWRPRGTCPSRVK